MITLFVGGHEVLLHRITVGQFAEFMVYMVQLTWPMIAIGWVVNLFQRGTASVVRIDELLKQQPSIADDPSLVTSSPLFQNASSAEASLHTAANRPLIPPAPESSTSFGPSSFAPPLLSSRSAAVGSASPSQEPTPAHATQAIQGSITFQHLNFSYLPNTPVLRDINLHIPAGSSLAIVGPTGSGKSTLVGLVPRLSRRLAGRGPHRRPSPSAPTPSTSSAQASASSPRKPSCSPTTIAQNIALGVPAANSATDRGTPPAPPTSRTEILEFPKGFATIVGERGVTLSGGQKQRTAIARALLRNPRILILDDALASVDTFTEEQILSGLRQQYARAAPPSSSPTASPPPATPTRSPSSSTAASPSSAPTTSSSSETATTPPSPKNNSWKKSSPSPRKQAAPFAWLGHTGAFPRTDRTLE